MNNRGQTTVFYLSTWRARVAQRWPAIVHPGWPTKERPDRNCQPAGSPLRLKAGDQTAGAAHQSGSQVRSSARRLQPTAAKTTRLWQGATTSGGSNRWVTGDCTGLSKFPATKTDMVDLVTALSQSVYSHLRKINSLLRLNYEPVALESTEFFDFGRDSWATSGHGPAGAGQSARGRPESAA